MGALEGGLVALVILFYVVRAVYRGLRWMVLGVRRALGQPAPAPVVRARPTAPPAMPLPQSVPLPRPEARPRRPEAGAVAVPQPATDARFREQMSQLEAIQEEAQRPTERVPRPPVSDKLILRPDGKDLVRALIWQEILSPPRSQRGHRHTPR